MAGEDLDRNRPRFPRIDATGGPVELVLYREGNHVCDSVAYKARPMRAGWTARRLGLSGDWA